MEIIMNWAIWALKVQVETTVPTPDMETLDDLPTTISSGPLHPYGWAFEYHAPRPCLVDLGHETTRKLPPQSLQVEVLRLGKWRSQHIHMYVRMYVCMYVCMHACMNVCIYAETRQSGSPFRPPPEARI